MMMGDQNDGERRHPVLSPLIGRSCRSALLVSAPAGLACAKVVALGEVPVLVCR
jgi:hypothetical protein